MDCVIIALLKARVTATDTPVKSKIDNEISVSNALSQVQEHRFNVIVHGIKESPPDTPRYQRHKSY